MKFAIIGAGQGGLRSAKLLAKAGYEVDVYEKCPRNSIGYDQIDAVEEKMFEDLGIERPDNSYKAFVSRFVPPFSEKKLLVKSEYEARDRSVDRHTFSRMLVKSAEEDGAVFHFETTVESLIQDSNGVYGIVVDGKQIFCDLVIDSSGVHSPFRSSLGGKFGITVHPAVNDVFNVYHGYYEPDDDAKWTEDTTFNLYLKFLGGKSIAWCGLEECGLVSMLIGNIGPFTKEDCETQLAEIRKLNPVLSDKLVKGGFFATIPLRYPLTKMSCKGYVAVGDAAFMTIPIMGNGISNSIRAGQMLAESIISACNVSEDTLWKYQVNYYKSIGAFMCFIDFVKRGLLESDNDSLTMFIEDELVNDQDVTDIFSGRIPKWTVKELERKVTMLFRGKPFLKTLGVYALKGVKAMKIAYEIPADYDLKKIYEWQYKLENCFR